MSRRPPWLREPPSEPLPAERASPTGDDGGSLYSHAEFMTQKTYYVDDRIQSSCGGGALGLGDVSLAQIGYKVGTRYKIEGGNRFESKHNVRRTFVQSVGGGSFISTYS